MFRRLAVCLFLLFSSSCWGQALDWEGSRYLCKQSTLTQVSGNGQTDIDGPMTDQSNITAYSDHTTLRAGLNNGGALTSSLSNPSAHSTAHGAATTAATPSALEVNGSVTLSFDLLEPSQSYFNSVLIPCAAANDAKIKNNTNGYRKVEISYSAYFDPRIIDSVDAEDLGVSTRLRMEYSCPKASGNYEVRWPGSFSDYTKFPYDGVRHDWYGPMSPDSGSFDRTGYENDSFEPTANAIVILGPYESLEIMARVNCSGSIASGVVTAGTALNFTAGTSEWAIPDTYTRQDVVYVSVTDLGAVAYNDLPAFWK